MIDADSLGFLVAVILIAVAFEFANGFNDAANAIATVVSTRVMSPLAAVTMAAIMNFVGAVSGTAVAKAVATGVVDPQGITSEVVAGGVAAAAKRRFRSASRTPARSASSLNLGVSIFSRWSALAANAARREQRESISCACGSSAPSVGVCSSLCNLALS